ncbi:hypothetical protein GCM10025787_43230 [Saccharopolyspora rosea]
MLVEVVDVDVRELAELLLQFAEDGGLRVNGGLHGFALPFHSRSRSRPAPGGAPATAPVAPGPPRGPSDADGATPALRVVRRPPPRAMVRLEPTFIRSDECRWWTCPI